MNIIINATEYTDKTYGNTYHSGLIYVNREDGRLDVYNLPFAYGGNGQYLTEAGRILDREGVINLKHYNSGGIQSIVSYCQENGIVFYNTCTKVSRKKDMI